MSTSYSYNEILNQIQRFPLQEQRRLLKDLATMLSKSKAQPRHSLLELEGLGKEIWQGIDPQQYVDEERNSWDG
jgi:hypothetical protein